MQRIDRKSRIARRPRLSPRPQPKSTTGLGDGAGAAGLIGIMALLAIPGVIILLSETR